jgi:hypothetical protein
MMKKGRIYHMSNYVHTQTATHSIEISDGCLSIGEDLTLSEEDTQLVLEALLISQHGLQPSSDDEEAE